MIIYKMVHLKNSDPHAYHEFVFDTEKQSFCLKESMLCAEDAFTDPISFSDLDAIEEFCLRIGIKVDGVTEHIEGLTWDVIESLGAKLAIDRFLNDGGSFIQRED